MIKVKARNGAAVYLALNNIKLKVMRTGKALLGVLAGVAAGAAIGMLFAPHRGEKTRRKISKKSKDLADAINQNIDDRLGDLLKSISNAVNCSSKVDQPSATNPPK
jgi:gas vesicle protein